MILQEKIQKKAEGYGKLSPVFLEGAKFALENQWISVEDDLPCNHEELIVNHDNAITTIVLVCYCYKGNVYGIDYMFNITKRELGWEWSKGTPCYWMPIPELPKSAI